MTGNSQSQETIHSTPYISQERYQALKTAIAHIEKQFGKGSIMRLGQTEHIKVEAIPSGSLALDIALGIGGFPRGRISEIFGQESSGKTTLALLTIANAQKLGGIAAFIDAEHALDPNYAKALGVNLDTLYISQPDSGEQALGIVDILCRSNAVDLIVIDSVAALVPQAELSGEIGDQYIGLQARLMSQSLRRLASIVSKSKTCVIFINQIREKVGVMFGNPETTPGGRALKFYSSVRVELRRMETIRRDKESVGAKIKAKVVKNKLAPPFREAVFNILFGVGVDNLSEAFDLGLQVGVIKRAGSWYSIGEHKLGQGKDMALTTIRESEKLIEELADSLATKFSLDSERLKLLLLRSAKLDSQVGQEGRDVAEDISQEDSS